MSLGLLRLFEPLCPLRICLYLLGDLAQTQHKLTHVCCGLGIALRGSFCASRYARCADLCLDPAHILNRCGWTEPKPNRGRRLCCTDYVPRTAHACFIQRIYKVKQTLSTQRSRRDAQQRRTR